MAFNPFSTFQKNRRFWMAAILMVCMVVFIFCTGMKNDMQERIMAMVRPKSPPIVRVGGYSLSREDLYELKSQRTLANEIMTRCADIAFKKLTKLWFEEGQKPLDNQGMQ